MRRVRTQAQDRILQRLRYSSFGAPFGYNDVYTVPSPAPEVGLERWTPLVPGQRPVSYQPRPTAWVHRHVLPLQANGLLPYGDFSIGWSQLEDLVRYIDHQEERHRTQTFQEEYRNLLNKYHMEFDERYVWD